MEANKLMPIVKWGRKGFARERPVYPSAEQDIQKAPKALKKKENLLECENYEEEE